jgi:hypothetical protein
VGTQTKARRYGAQNLSRELVCGVLVREDRNQGVVLVSEDTNQGAGGVIKYRENTCRLNVEK